MSRQKLTEAQIHQKRQKALTSIEGWGEEPSWDKKFYLDPNEFQKDFQFALNWYNTKSTPEKCKKWFLEWYQHNSTPLDYLRAANQPDTIFANVHSYLARLLVRKAPLPDSSLEKLKTFVSTVILAVKVNPDKKETKPILEFPVIKLYDVIDLSIEEFLLKNKELQLQLVEKCKEFSANKKQALKTIGKFTTFINELNLLLQDDCPTDLKEGYSNLSVPKIKKLIHFFEDLKEQTHGIETPNKGLRKTKPKKVNPAKVVKKVQFLEVWKIPNTSFVLKSISPTEIIGCKELWVYNTEKNRLGRFVTKNKAGLTIFGTSIRNHDEVLGAMKKIKKPEKILVDLMKTEKDKLTTFWATIRSAPMLLRSRLSADIIILRAIK